MDIDSVFPVRGADTACDATGIADNIYGQSTPVNKSVQLRKTHIDLLVVPSATDS
jgi:hypothetical protein